MHGIDLILSHKAVTGPRIRDEVKFLVSLLQSRRHFLHLTVRRLIGSAAMNNAAQFRSQTTALLLGQTIGEKPNSYAEVRNLTLPNSHLTVRYSTRYYKFSESPDNTIRPDREIIPTWAKNLARRLERLEDSPLPVLEEPLVIRIISVSLRRLKKDCCLRLKKSASWQRQRRHLGDMVGGSDVNHGPELELRLGAADTTGHE